MTTKTKTTRQKMPKWLLLVSLLAVFAVFAASCGDDDSDSSATTTTTTAAPTTTVAPEPDPPMTQGPGGEEAVPASEIALDDNEIAEVQAGGYTAALLWHTSGAFTDAVSQGARNAFEELGIEVIAETDAGFDAAQQANDVETVMAQDPDIIISLAIGPDAGAEAFRPAVNAGVQLVFLSNVPQGYVHGQDYVGIVTDDLAAMGITAADLLADALGGEGEVGFIFHDADYYVDQASETRLSSPGSRSTTPALRLLPSRVWPTRPPLRRSPRRCSPATPTSKASTLRGRRVRPMGLSPRCAPPVLPMWLS